jgi:hypothetical protein
MADDQLIYPRGQIALANGDLIDVTNVKVDITNNAKQVHTIRQKGAGITLGVEETTVTFDAVVSEEGAERDYLRDIKKGIIRKLRVKVPEETITVNGMAQARSLELPLDDAVKYSITFIGHTEDS